MPSVARTWIIAFFAFGRKGLYVSGDGPRGPRLRVNGARRADRGYGGGEQLVLGDRVGVGVGVEHDRQPQQEDRPTLGDRFVRDVDHDRLIARIELRRGVFDCGSCPARRSTADH